MIKKATTTKKRLPKIPVATVHIKCSVNNTIVTVSSDGNKLFQVTPPTLGLNGPKKPTPYAAQAVMNKVLQRILDYGTVSIDVQIAGVGPAREAALRTLLNKPPQLSVTRITDKTAVVHNGTRPPGAKSL